MLGHHNAQPAPQTSRNQAVSQNEVYSPSVGSENVENNRNTNGRQAAAGANNAKTNEEIRRKSNVVKEIEKIQKNREQRRANQEEKRQKLNEIDQSVPAWEFAQMIADFRSTLEFTRLTMTEAVPDFRISVCVRKRPINKKELSKKDIDVITMPTKDLCLVHLPRLKVDLTKYLDNQKFRFDFAFDESSSNDLCYKYNFINLFYPFNL